MSIPLEEKIKDWLFKGGLPFEMEVANLFLNAGFMVAQSIYYKDPESNKFRETDIIAFKSILVDNIWVNLTFVIECKSSQDKPWILLSNERISNTVSNKREVYHTEGFETIYNKIDRENFKSNLIFKNTSKYGYSLITALNGQAPDKTYEAVQSVTKSCEYFVKSSNTSSRDICNLYFPVIITKGDFFIGEMVDKDISIKHADSGELLISRSFHFKQNISIRVFTEKNLKNNIECLNKECDDFFKYYKDILKERLTGQHYS